MLITEVDSKISDFVDIHVLSLEDIIRRCVADLINKDYRKEEIQKRRFSKRVFRDRANKESRPLLKPNICTGSEPYWDYRVVSGDFLRHVGTTCVSCGKCLIALAEVHVTTKIVGL